MGNLRMEEAVPVLVKRYFKLKHINNTNISITNKDDIRKKLQKKKNFIEINI